MLVFVLQESMRSLTRGAQQLILQDLPWEPLEVDPSVALEVFSHSRYMATALSLPLNPQTPSPLFFSLLMSNIQFEE